MDFTFDWRGEFSNDEMNALHAEAFDHRLRDDDWAAQFTTHSLGWVCAFDEGGALVGAVNVPWDGGAHAFIMDTVVADRVRRHGVGKQLVQVAADQAKAAGCEWLHVDFEGEELSRFYLGACGFVPTSAGLIDLTIRRRATGP